MQSNEFVRSCLPEPYEFYDEGNKEWMNSVYQLSDGRFVATNGHVMGMDFNYTGYSTMCAEGSAEQTSLAKKIDQEWIKSPSQVSALDGFFMPFTDQIQNESLCVIGFAICEIKVLAVIQRKYLLLAREALGVESGISIHYLSGVKIQRLEDFLVYNGPLKFETAACELSLTPIQRLLLVMTVSLDDCKENIKSLKNWQTFDSMVIP